MATFTLKIQRRIESGLITCGKFDGSHAYLAAATAAGNVLIHNPYQEENAFKSSLQDNNETRLSWSGEVAELQIGRQVTALSTGRLGDDERDTLFVGTSTHLLAYQVYDNADLFYKELADGVYCIAVGKVGWIQESVIVVGGNGSIIAIDRKGDEVFWTAANDRVTSLMLFDFDGDGENELLSGSADFSIRVQKGDLVLWETAETGPVIILAPIIDNQFAYGVEKNGTVGVYESNRRVWRLKSKHKIVSIKRYDINGDGQVELITGWSNGRVDARSRNNGQVIFKIQISTPIAGLVEADYRKTGLPDLVIVTVSGELRGYASGIANTEPPDPGELVRELLTRKQALERQVKTKGGDSNYYLSSRLADNLVASRGAVRLSLASGPGILIHYAMVFAEGVFEGETLVVHPQKPRGEVEIELQFVKNVPVDMHVKICVGAPGSELLSVLELTKHLPQFCMFEPVSRPDGLAPEGYVIAELSERAQRIALWLGQSFLLPDEIHVPDVGPEANRLEVWFLGMRNQGAHCIECDSVGRLTVRTDDPVFAGDVVQSLANYLGIRELASEAHFPEEERKMLVALDKFRNYKEVEARLQAETAGSLNLVKGLVVRLEDARILENPEDMRRRLGQLRTVNGDLIRDHEIRSKSFGELLGALRELNVGVQTTCRLRVGRAATSVVARCRSAITENNPKTLIQALQHG